MNAKTTAQCPLARVSRLSFIPRGYITQLVRHSRSYSCSLSERLSPRTCTHTHTNANDPLLPTDSSQSVVMTNPSRHGALCSRAPSRGRDIIQVVTAGGHVWGLVSLLSGALWREHVAHRLPTERDLDTVYWADHGLAVLCMNDLMKTADEDSRLSLHPHLCRDHPKTNKRL